LGGVWGLFWGGGGGGGGGAPGPDRGATLGYSKSEARTLLVKLLDRAGAPSAPEGLALQVDRKPRDKAEELDWWKAAPADKDAKNSARKSAYLAFYYQISENGKRFFARGIPLDDGQVLWPDRAVINAGLTAELVTYERPRFALTPAGLESIKALLAEPEAASG
jgi:hypothetical protein